MIEFSLFLIAINLTWIGTNLARIDDKLNEKK